MGIRNGMKHIGKGKIGCFSMDLSQWVIMPYVRKGETDMRD